MKTTQKMIRSYLADKNITAVDCTSWNVSDYVSHSESEGGFDEVARSHGTYGTNGLVMKGRQTGIYYVVPSRSSALFLFPW